MKVWELLIENNIFNESKESLYKEAEKDLIGLQQDMINIFVSNYITIERIKKKCLKPHEYDESINNWWSLLNLEVYRFIPKVIKGGKDSKHETSQVTLNDFIKADLKVVKRG